VQIAEYRASLRRTFEEQYKRIESSFGELSDEQLSWSPDEKTWSVGHCLYHIWLTNDKYLVEVLNALKEARYPAPDEQDYESNGMGRRFIAKIGPDGGPNVPVPKSLKPEKKKVPLGIRQLVMEQLTAFDEFVQESHRVDMVKTKLRSPVMPLVRLQLGDVFKALAGHNERHLRQAERIMRTAGFPGGARASAAPVS